MGSIFDIHTVNVCDCTDEDFLLDTNALLWAFYPNSQSGNSSAADYSNFISDIISSNKHIYIPMFNVCEAIHVIERIQYKIYKDTNGIYNLKLKDFRSIPQERNNLKQILNLFWQQLCNIPQIIFIDETIDSELPQKFIDTFEQHSLDLFDTLLYKLSNEKKYAIITDDKDFSSVSIVGNIYSCNSNFFSATPT